ncbi:uncharacterized protein BDFB_010971, partial [Asbolus verrucosus]
ALVDDLIQELRELDGLIQNKIEVIENLDISINIITYKVYEATHEFRIRITEIKDERNKLLTSVENRSELSLILSDLDRKISDLEQALENKINKQTESIILQLDDDISKMQEQTRRLKKILGTEKDVAYQAQLILINEKYVPAIEQFECHLHNYEHLQLTGWRIEHSEVKLAEILEEQGLKFTPSGRLLTRTGSLITFEEAQQKGYFKELHVSLEKIFDFFKEYEHEREREHDRSHEPIVVPDSAIFSGTSGSSLQSKMSSEDVKYLKQHIGKPLALALAEITAKQPRDPIHYLGHYLFKYRYNQELEEVQKREVEELTNERRRVAQEKWKKFVEEEARNAVIEMVLKAEEIAYQNELRRIEREQMLAEGEEEGDEDESALVEEAKDKFE